MESWITRVCMAVCVAFVALAGVSAPRVDASALACSASECDYGVAEYDQPVTGSVYLRNYGSNQDIWTFLGNQGDHVKLSFEWDPGSTDGNARIYHNGDPLSPSGSVVILPAAGEFDIVVRPDIYYGTYNYTMTVLVNNTPPTTTAAITNSPRLNGWYNEPVTVEITQTDDVGNRAIYYDVSGDSSQWIGTGFDPGEPAIVTVTKGLNGWYTLKYKGRDTFENESAEQIIQFGVDKNLPVITRPSWTMVDPVSKVANKAQVKLAWTGADSHSGIQKYEIQRSTNGGVTWVSVSNGVSTSTSKVVQLPSEITTLIQMRAWDNAGNVSAWTSPISIAPTVAQGDAATFTGTWQTASSSVYAGGSTRASGMANQTATIQFTGTKIYWVATRAKFRGIAEVIIDGRSYGQIDLYNPTTQYRRIVFQKTNLSSGAHTLVIKVTGQRNALATKYGIDVDAVIWVQ